MRLTRLTERSDFVALTAHGRRHRAASFTAQVRDQAAAGAADHAQSTDRGDARKSALRLGLTASRRVGNAPVRNRIRRRLRAAAAIALADKASEPVDLVLVARREVLGVPFSQLIADIAASLSPRPPKAQRPSPRTASRHRNDSAP